MSLITTPNVRFNHYHLPVCQPSLIEEEDI